MTGDPDTLSGLDFGSTIRGFSAGQVLFDRYRLERVLGRGGMGVVWLAHDQQLGEDIALKFLPEAVRLDALALEELKRETRKSRKLTHQHIVRVYNFLSDANCAGISMEWIDGATLAALRMNRPNLVFEPDDLKTCVRQVCEALEYAHGTVKLIHRDLKPANIMLTVGGEAKITDFGISSSLTESVSRVSVQNTSSGTLAYMSPQQALGERPTPSDDIYSLGATIFELVAGKPPFFRGDLYIQIRDIVPESMTERRSESEIPADKITKEWEDTVAACLSKDPANRPQTAMEVAWRLGLVKDFERRAPIVMPRPDIIRVPQQDGTKTVVTQTGGTISSTFFTPPPGPLTETVVPPLQKYRLPLIAGAAALLLLAGLLIWHFASPKPAPVVKNATPAPSATPLRPAVTFVSPAPTAPPAPAPTAAPTAVAVASPVPVAPLATPTPAIAAAPTMTPAPAASAKPVIAAAPSAAPTAAPSVAPNATATPAIAAAPTMAPAISANPSATPAIPAASAQPTAIAVAMLASPTPAGSVTAPGASPAPLAGASPSPIITGTLDKQLVGHWQTGSTSSPTRLTLVASGKYTLSVDGDITDTGTMSGSDGNLQEVSKNNSQPAMITYQINDDGDLLTHGDGTFDEATWHRITVTRHRTTDSDSGSGPGLGTKIKNTFKKIF